MRNAAREAFQEPLVRAVLAAVIVGGIGVGLDGDRDIVVVIAVATGVLTWEITGLSHVLRRRSQSLEDQQSLLALLGTGLNPPLFGAWAIAPDFGRILLDHLRRRPAVVVECGSGASTLVIASALAANGRGKLYSLDHDSAFAEQTRSLLADRGLSDRAEVITTPLARQTFETTEVPWYDTKCIPDFPDLIDLLVIDGPPPTEPLSRWPALHAFYPQLSPQACVLLDDGRRRSERRTALLWAAAFPDLALHWIDTEKGTWMLSRDPEAGHASRLGSAGRRLRRALHPRPPGFGHWPISR